MLAALLCCTLSGFAEEKPIELSQEKIPHERSEVQLPTASIDGRVLTISFVTNCSFEVSVVDESGVVVYTGTFPAQGTTITLPNLPTGEYELVIEDTTHIYSGEFDIE